MQVASDLLVLAVNADPVGDVAMTWEELTSLAKISRATLRQVLFRLEVG